MNLIAAVDSNWAIGNKERLLVSIPNDHKHFREETTGKVVVLGRKTLQTFPQGLPLKNRTNIILSRDRNYEVKDALVVHSVEELLEELQGLYRFTGRAGLSEAVAATMFRGRFKPERFYMEAPMMEFYKPKVW